MTRTPVAPRKAPLHKSSHRNHVLRVKRGTGKESTPSVHRSPRRSSNIFHLRTARDSIIGDSDDDQENELPTYGSPQAKSRPSYTWDDEKTLVTALIDDEDDHVADPDAKLSRLADSLREPFARAGTALIQDMAHTLQPAVQRVTSAHRTLTRHVDTAYATGLLAFDDACKLFELATIEDQQALQQAFTATAKRIKGLFERLEEAYRHRDKLWTDLDTYLAAEIDPVIASLAEVPSATERTINTLEKHARNMATKDDDSAKIQSMLAKLT
ncbi:unnamed protein product [Mycena citricolor]|uniref:Uncharacterized protein n=1 Tax=Mycena citricolor TaxID=2018698 RepID=A0AAD2Q558_9AGAR|nr:unnamed protein product [Mycena citricolor]